MGWDTVYCPVCKSFTNDGGSCKHYRSFERYVTAINFNEFVEFCKEKYGEVRILNKNEIEVLIQTNYCRGFECDFSNGFISFDKGYDEHELLRKILSPDCSYEQMFKDYFESRIDWSWDNDDPENDEYDVASGPETFKELLEDYDAKDEIILSDKLRDILNNIHMDNDDFYTFVGKNKFAHRFGNW